MNLQKIALAAAIECERQKVGLNQVAGLLLAYQFAYEQATCRCRYTTKGHKYLPRVSDVLVLISKVEPYIKEYRKVPVTFNHGTKHALDWSAVGSAMQQLFDDVVDFAETPRDAHPITKQFLDIHPFEDGNGRVAWILYNWLSNTLENPLPLPDFYGK